MIVNDYKANGHRSLARLEDALEHLREFFTDYRAVEITGDRVTAYVTIRQDQKAANATINNELAALSRMFTLGVRSNKVATRPYIGKLAVSNTRKGFFEWEQFSPVLKNLPSVRNLERAGVSRSDAMKMVGHKTESIYRRYVISDERSMRESAGKLDKFHAADQRQQNRQ
jgi:hypothetical protein